MRLLDAAEHQQRVAEVVQGDAEVVAVPELGGDADRLTEVRDAGVRVTAVGEGHAELLVRTALLGGGADRLGDRQRIERPAPASARELARSAAGRPSAASPMRARRRLLRQQLQRPLELPHRRLRGAVQPAEQLVQRSRPAGIGPGIHERDRRGRDGKRALDVAGQAGGIGEAAQQLDLVDVLRPVLGATCGHSARARSSWARAAPKAQTLLRGGGGRDRGGERRPHGAGRHASARASAAHSAAPRAGTGEAASSAAASARVQRPALAGHQLAVHRFAGERVTERVPLALARRARGRPGARVARRRASASSTPAAASSVSWSIPRPAVADDLRATCRAASDTPATRTSSSERSEAGSSGADSPAARAASSSSAKYGLPSARACTHATSSGIRAAADDALHLQRRRRPGQRIEVEALGARAPRQLARQPRAAPAGRLRPCAA